MGFSFTEIIVSDENPVCEVWQKKLPLIKIANDKIVSLFHELNRFVGHEGSEIKHSNYKTHDSSAIIGC